MYGSLFLLAVLTILYFAGVIGFVKYSPVAGVLFLVFAVTYLGVETITKVTFLGTSIERDVTAAREIKEEIRNLAKIIVEVMNGMDATTVTFGRAESARESLRERLAALECLAEPDVALREQWRADMAVMFSENDNKGG